MRWKSAALVRAEGIRPPPIHSLPAHFTSLLPEILCRSLPLFTFWRAFFFPTAPPPLSVVRLIKKHLQLFLVQGWKHCYLITLLANQIPFQSPLPPWWSGADRQWGCPSGTSFYSLWGRGGGGREDKLLYGGMGNAFWRVCICVCVWDGVGCQFLSDAKVCVAAGPWRGDSGREGVGR